MFKIMIVDDFFVERENAIEIINESDLELEIVGTFANGEEAYGEIENKCPDFMLVDIEMPVMNGLELGQLVKDNFPDIKIIFFSFYDKFEYIKKAMDLDAYSYILKPIIKEEMINSLEVVIKQRKRELKEKQNEHQLKDLIKKSKPLLLDKFKRDLFNGLFIHSSDIWERITYLELNLEKERYIVLVLEIDDYNSLVESKSYEEKEMFTLNISRILEKLLCQQKSYIFVNMDNSHWAILLTKGLDLHLELTGQAYDLAETLVEAFILEKISMSIGISDVLENIQQINELYLQAVNVLKYKFNKGKGSIIHYNEVQETIQNNDIPLSEMQNQIRQALNSKSFSLGWQYIDRFFLGFNYNISEFTIKNACFGFIICLQIALNDFGLTVDEIFGKEQILWEKLMKFETIKDVKMWLKNIFSFVVEYITKKQQNQSKNIISEVKKHVDKHYNENITIKAIADELYYNPNYLNNAFKNETGETILDYITRIRIEVSKKILLEHPEMKLYQICEAVGYKNESYFRNVFKRYTGLNPKAFKERANMK